MGGRRGSRRTSTTAFWGSRSSAPRPLPGSGSSPSSAQGCREDKAPERVGSGLPRNVLSERERRKRISVSCERLRALLPRFDGRREDMASVLEMSVQFLRLAGGLVPSQEPPTAALAPSKETWHKWQRDVLQLALSSPTSAGAPDSRMAAPGVTVTQASTAGVAEGEAPLGAAEVLDGPPALPEALQPGDPAPRPKSLQGPEVASTLASPLLAATFPSGEQRGSELPGPGWAPDGGGRLFHDTGHQRSASGCDVEDGASFLLSASPDWWLGSLEGRGASVPSRSMARSSLLDRAEPSFLTDIGPSSQELPDSPLEPWGSDAGCPSLALRDEVDSIFPDFFPC
ncbi:spermatogenesis- and oogenesis-specific basic helix-loop-helix-containing protein 1 isoform X1 [Prionailurus iriomotensis]